MKWFTYCGHRKTGSENRWSRPPTTNHSSSRRYGASSSQKFGLLLHSDDENDPITDDDVVSLMKDDLAPTLFPHGYYVIPGDTENDRVVTSSTAYSVLPDRAESDDAPLRVVNGIGAVADVDLYQRFNDCRSLVKAIGCKHCPDQGATCLTRSLPVAADGERATPLLSEADDDTARDLFKNRKTKLGVFTYISPKLTIPENHVFVPSYRHFGDHDFGRIDENSAAISGYSKTAAAGRAFQKTNCRVCPLDKACYAFRSCAGAYPVEAEVSRQLLVTWQDKLAVETFKPWQFWALARCGGAEGTYRVNSHVRYRVVLHGLRFKNGGWAVDVWRCKTDVGFLVSINDWATLCALFPSLPTTEDEAAKAAYRYGRPENDTVVALYLQLTEHTRSERHRGGWGGDKYTLAYKQLHYDRVEVQYAGPRYMRYRVDIKNYRNFYSEITYSLGVPQTKVRKGLNIYSND